MKEVKSSTISHVGFENEKLHVRFKSNPKTTYVYDATEGEHKALMEAPSIGRHFAASIKGRDFTKKED